MAEKKRLWLLSGAAAVIVGGSVALAITQPWSSMSSGADAAHSEAGQLAGSAASGGQADVWRALSRYERTYLKSWKGAFDDPNPPAADVLDAFNEVAYASTGPSGFWRNKVPNMWMGCKAEPSSEICQTLKKASAEFAKWDKFQDKVGNLDPAKAKKFLAKNAKKMKAYLARYVPTRPNASAMEKTGFYKSQLETVMAKASSRSAAETSADDL